jgi:undecaprenyl-diphosphatase
MKGFFTDKKIRIFCYKIVFLCAISGVLGIILLNLIKNIRYNLNLAAFSLVALGFIMIFIEKTNKTVKGVNDIKNITWRQNLYIGFIQALSLIPGVSRSGATVCGGLQNGLDKKTAVKYSFFISIPINIMSCVFDVYKNYDIMLNQGQLIALLVFMFNFIFSLFFIKKALEFFEKINLKFFGYYRILVALIIFLTLR